MPFECEGGAQVIDAVREWSSLTVGVSTGPGPEDREEQKNKKMENGGKRTYKRLNKSEIKEEDKLQYRTGGITKDIRRTKCDAEIHIQGINLKILFLTLYP